MPVYRLSADYRIGAESCHASRFRDARVGVRWYAFVADACLSATPERATPSTARHFKLVQLPDKILRNVGLLWPTQFQSVGISVFSHKLDLEMIDRLD